MEYRIFDRMEECTEAEVQRLLPTVSPQRREQALRFKHLSGRYACLKTYSMLISLLREDNKIGPNDLPLFAISEHGKPSLVGYPMVHFNISHCKNALLVAIHNQPVGVDIERIVEAKESLMEYTMNEQELDYIHQDKEPNVRFTELWTQKEALLKLLGSGIQGGIKQALAHKEDFQLITTIGNHQDYIFSIATHITPTHEN